MKLSSSWYLFRASEEDYNRGRDMILVLVSSLKDRDFSKSVYSRPNLTNRTLTEKQQCLCTGMGTLFQVGKALNDEWTLTETLHWLPDRQKIVLRGRNGGERTWEKPSHKSNEVEICISMCYTVGTWKQNSGKKRRVSKIYYTHHSIMKGIGANGPLYNINKIIAFLYSGVNQCLNLWMIS